ncbi:PAS domain S-box-containing protein [Syntrophus gentianae]|uniref:HTH-type transcriptional regulatory protein TyrR n=1 Tax=Syntrophus gentianae TaxID=43775 RepID=A0A1H7WF29_9BACT|nr:sigma 54-interacting transcriptional regulator [Syntrophus gentianae]SEM20090.1 PAS domain S-box-containing protein [Syntrophus gentianae]
MGSDMIYEMVTEDIISTITDEINIGSLAVERVCQILSDSEIAGEVLTRVITREKFHGLNLLDVINNEFKELNSIFQDSYDGISVVNKHGRVTRVNKAFERLTGIKIKNVLGVDLYKIKKEGTYFDPTVALKVLETGKPVTILQKFAQGKEIMAIGNPVFDENGKVIWVVVNLRDVTELKQLEEKLRKTQELNAQYLFEMESMRKKYTSEHCLVSKSKEMEKIIELATRVSMVESPVLIHGESGVGKEIIANVLHNMNTKRKKAPLIKVNCGAIPKELIESEFFGYEPGAFTGASRCGKPGMFELANKGTIFLDEIGELPLGLQVKLLRVLQEHEITRLGGVKTIKIDVRVVAATNRDLEMMIKDKSFREDLYYRINVIPIRIPSLRERKDDIAPLLFHFLDIYNKKYDLKKSLSDEVVECLLKYEWPGNVRELINLIERLVVTTDVQQICLENLPHRYRTQTDSSFYRMNQMNLTAAVEELERYLVNQAIKSQKSTYKAAKALGVSQSTVVRLAKKYKVNHN